MKTRHILWLLVFIPFLTSCYREHYAPASDYIFGYWRYQAGVDVQMDGMEPGVIPFASMTLRPDGTMSGMTSRNILGGTFRYESPNIIKLDFRPLTRVYDTPWSARFQQMLSEVDRYQLTGDALTLTNSATGDALEFLRLSPNICAPIPNNQQLFEQAVSDPFTFKDVLIAGSCLEVTIEYGGGCGEVEALLIGSGNYMESLPQQIKVKLILNDDDPCEALLRKTFYFNLNTILPAGEDAVVLHLDGWPLDIHYTMD